MMFYHCYSIIIQKVGKMAPVTEFPHKAFGQRLKQRREALYPPVTQRELAKKLGVSAGYVAHMEKGRTMPGRKTLKSLAKALGMPETEVLKEAGFLSQAPENQRIIDDPELWLFFKEDWPTLSKEDRAWFKLFIRMVKEKNKARQNQSDSHQ